MAEKDSGKKQKVPKYTKITENEKFSKRNGVVCA